MALNDSRKLVSLDFEVHGQKLYNTSLKSAEQATDRFGNKLGAIIAVQNTKLVKSTDAAGNSINKFSGTFTHAGGAVTTSTATMKKGIVSVTASTKNMGDSTKQATGMIGDFTRALKRVIIVVPLWATLRAVMQAVSSTIRDGFEQVKKFSKELLRASSVISGTVLTTGQALDVLKNSVKNLSKETGVSVDNLTNAFYRFGTVGNDFESSMDGMTASLRTSMAMQGDITSTAKTMALTYKLLGDTIDKSLSPQKQQLLMGAQLFKLYRTNAFEMNEMDAALRQFLPTANSANFTYAESISLLGALQSAGLKSSRAGRLLRTSVSKLVQNLGKLAGELGLSVNPEVESTFDVLMKVLGAIKKLDKEGKELPIQRLSVLKEIFGGVRTQEAGKAMVSVLKLIKKNLTDTGLDKNNILLREFAERIKTVTDDTSTLIERNKNLKKHIGEAFLIGITGSDDLNDALMQFNRTLEGTITNTKSFSEFLRIAFFALGTGLGVIDLARYDAQIINASKSINIMDKALRGIKGEDTRKGISETLRELVDPENQKALLASGQTLENIEQTIKSLIQASHRLEGKEAMELEVRMKINKTQIEKQIKEELFPIEITEDIKIPVSVETDITKYKEQLKLVQQELVDSTKMQLSEQKLTNFVKDRVKQHNKLVGLEEQGLQKISENFVLANALSGNYKKIIAAMGEVNANEEFLKKLVKEVFEYKKSTLQTEKDLAAIENKRLLEKLAASGATELQIANKRVELATTDKELQEAIHRLELSRLKIISKRVQQIKSVTQSAIKIGIEEGDIDSFLQKFREGIRETMIDSLSTGLTESLMSFTGIGQTLGGVFATAEQKLPMALNTAFENGGNSVALKISNALSTAQFGGIGGGAGAGVGGFGVGTKGIKDAVEKGTVEAQKKSAFNMQNFQKLMGVGLLAFGLFGGKSKGTISQRYQTADAFNGVSGTSDPTTRSSTRAKITSIVVTNTFQLDGASLNERRTVESYAEKIKLVTKQVFDKLSREGIASGEY